MDLITKHDEGFIRYYKGTTKKPIREESRDVIFSILVSYIKSIDKEGLKALNHSQVSRCYRLSPYIIKKKFLFTPIKKDSTNEVKDKDEKKDLLKTVKLDEVYQKTDRVYWELEALDRLKSYNGFPKVIYAEPENGVFYMTYCGTPLKEIRSKSALPDNFFLQIDDIINALKKEDVFHCDLALEHLLIKDGRVSLIDFEKCFLSKKQFEAHKKKGTWMYRNLTYEDMSYIKEFLYEFYDKLKEY